jgi:diguanylate cyclase (GGDEF)-like protein
MSDFALECIRAVVLAGLLVFLVRTGRTRFRGTSESWNLIVAGFGLLLFGSLLDITDNFPALNHFVFIGDTEIEAILEKLVGFLGGFVLLAVGLVRWIPQELRERERVERELTEKTRLLETTLNSIEQGFVVWDENDRLLICNQRYREFLDCPKDDVKPGTRMIDILRRQAEYGAYGEGEPEALAQARFEKVTRLRESGEEVLALPTGRVVYGRRSTVKGLGHLTTLTDITALKKVETALRESEERLQRLADTDPLTGIRNRRSFLEQGERELNRARRRNRTISLLMMDLDHFKRINDTHGHAVGDAVLKRFVAMCQGTLRDHDIFGRLGGEEFAVILTDDDIDGAAKVAERLRRISEDLRVDTASGPIGFTVSIGVSECGGPSETLEAGLHRADNALYTAKSDGRNRVVTVAA